MLNEMHTTVVVSLCDVGMTEFFFMLRIPVSMFLKSLRISVHTAATSPMGFLQQLSSVDNTYVSWVRYTIC